MTEGAVKLHVLKGPRVPETTGHPFLCEHFRGTLTGSECLRRQTLRTKAGAMAKDQSPRVPPHLEYCASGKCDQGAEIAKKFPGWKPEERPPAAVNWGNRVGPPSHPAPAEQQLKREVADVVLSMKKPTWREWKAEKDKREKDKPPAPEPVEHEPHPLSNRGMEESTMEGKKTMCSESGCQRSPITKGMCGMHYQRARTAAKDKKPRAPKLADLRGATAIEGRAKEIPGVKSNAERLTGQDEFDLMIAIRDSFRKLSEPGRLYVLAALELRK